MLKRSAKVATLWDEVTDCLSALNDDEVADPIREAMDEECKFDGFEATTRAYSLLLYEFPARAANITYFFDPGDGCYGYFSTLSEKKLVTILKRYLKKVQKLSKQGA